MNRLEMIRKAEAESHTAAYESLTLYAPGSWLSKPIRALEALLPLYAEREGLRVLDLGSGVGRNAIACARALKNAQVTCVDILPMAIEKLMENAESFGVSGRIQGICTPVDGFPIEPEGFDIILAGSVLEHLDSRASTLRTLDPGYSTRRGGDDRHEYGRSGMGCPDRGDPRSPVRGEPAAGGGSQDFGRDLPGLGSPLGQDHPL